MITLENVSAGYRTAGGDVVAVDKVDLAIAKSEIVGIAGESGCGKSTLLKLIYGQLGNGLELFSGHASWQVADTATATKAEIGLSDVKSLWWDKITYVPQVVNALNPILRVRDQVMDSMPARLKQNGTAALQSDLTAFFKELGLSEDVFDMFPFQLSGGMIQRVLIGLAAFPRPDMILADEPTTALDVVVQKRILILLHRIQRSIGNALVFVSHDLGVHYQIADRLVICYAGKIVEDGPTDAIFEHPRHPYTRALIDALPRVNDTARRQGLEGRPPHLIDPPKGCRFAARCQFAQDKCRTVEPENQTFGSTSVACHFPLEPSDG